MKAHNAGLYIHIPFCASKCPYCDFYSVRADDSLYEEYTEAIIDELLTQRRSAAFLNGTRPAVTSVYIGGGTPSVIGGKRIARIIKTAKKAYPVDNNAEITVEVNPASADDKFFYLARNAGASRVSLGLQSAVDYERRALGRLSGADKAKRAFEAARQSGFENISLDLMLGIPRQTEESLKQSVSFCASLGAEHISAYMLQIEEGTLFYKKQSELCLPDEDAVCGLYRLLVSELNACGYRQYEISNFAKPGFESRHNLNYWRCGEYIGVGAAAHSFFGGRRFCFPRSLTDFINGCSPVDDGEGGGMDEFIMLTLRTADGAKYADFYERFGVPMPDQYIKNAGSPALSPYIVFFDDGFALNSEGFLLSNTVIGKIIYG